MRICEEYEGSVRDSGYPTMPEISGVELDKLTCLEDAFARYALLRSKRMTGQSQAICELQHHVSFPHGFIPLCHDSIKVNPSTSRRRVQAARRLRSRYSRERRRTSGNPRSSSS